MTIYPEALRSSSSLSITADKLTLGYAGKMVAQDLSLTIPSGHFTAIIGPNGCGKSTLLKTLCRILKPLQGEILLDGQAIQHYPAKALAQRIGLLPQTASAPEGISVSELVSRGRYPYQSWLKQWSDTDQQAIEQAIRLTGLTELTDRVVDELSGGQRQRVWIAMVLAQQTPFILLDEPTTYLDITHQIELLELFSALHQQGRTFVAVLHDINQACRYATHLIAMRDGRIVAEGVPSQIVTPELMKTVFDLDCDVISDPVSATPLIIPHRKPVMYCDTE